MGEARRRRDRARKPARVTHKVLTFLVEAPLYADLEAQARGIGVSVGEFSAGMLRAALDAYARTRQEQAEKERIVSIVPAEVLAKLPKMRAAGALLGGGI